MGLFSSPEDELTRFANFIDEWSQCDFCFTNFGVILEYLESSIRLSSTWSWHVYDVVQCYPWFNFYFPLFLGMVMYDNEFETKGNKN